MSQDLMNPHVSPFDAIRQVDKTGREYWSARDLQKLLGYTRWQKFEDAIERAVIACKNSGQIPETNFTQSGKVTNKGKHGKYSEKDYHLTRYACYLVAMNSDPHKVEVSQAQTYFAIKTREAEIAKPQEDINEAFRLRRDANMWFIEKMRFTVIEKTNTIAMLGHLRALNFADNAFLDTSLAKGFYPWCKEQGYDMSLVRETEKAYLVGWELNEDRLTYNFDKPTYRKVYSYPVDPFSLAWEKFLVEYYWPQKFLPYIKRKYKGDERAMNIEAGIKVIGFYTGLQINQKAG